jgi:hypothetical protein
LRAVGLAPDLRDPNTFDIEEEAEGREIISRFPRARSVEGTHTEDDEFRVEVREKGLPTTAKRALSGKPTTPHIGLTGVGVGTGLDQEENETEEDVPIQVDGDDRDDGSKGPAQVVQQEQEGRGRRATKRMKENKELEKAGHMA